MTLESVYYLSQALSSLGVVVSLIYLGKQVNHSTRASSVQAKIATTGMQSQVAAMLASCPDLNDLVIRATKSTEGLSREEYGRFSSFCFQMFWATSTAHFQLRAGTLTDEDWFEIKASLVFYLNGAGVRYWWRKHGCARFAGRFAEFVDAEVLRCEAANVHMGAAPGGQTVNSRDQYDT